MLDWPIELISINDIFLDDKNIRSPISQVTQAALIQDLFVNEDAMEIARSISQSGMFPDEFPIAVKEGDNYIMIEGNRRLASLKAFAEPDLVPSFRDRIRNLVNRNIEKIRVVIAPNREEAVRFTANRHTINLRRAWKPLRQAFFYQSQLVNGKKIAELMLEYPEHDIPKFIRMLEMYKLAKSVPLDAKEQKLVSDDRKFPITTLERMYSDPYVKDYLKVSFDEEGKFSCAANWTDFVLPYRQIITDVANGKIDSRKHNTDEQRKEYIDKLPDEFNLKTKEDGNFSTEDITIEEFIEEKEEIPEEEKKKRSRGKKSKPNGLIPSYIKFGLNNAALKTVFDELYSIDVKKFPNASHDLLRSFLEGILVTFLKDIGELPSKNKKHNPTLDEMLGFISSGKCSKITDASLIQVVDHLKQKYNKNYSLVRMNMINHNEKWVTDEGDVRSAWANLEGLMKVLLKSE